MKRQSKEKKLVITGIAMFLLSAPLGYLFAKLYIASTCGSKFCGIGEISATLYTTGTLLVISVIPFILAVVGDKKK